jgi:hypothetical protein
VIAASRKSLSLWTKGDGKAYRAMIFTDSGGRIPAQQVFVAGPEWKQVTFPLSAFNGTDGHAVEARGSNHLSLGAIQTQAGTLFGDVAGRQAMIIRFIT